MLSQEFIQKMKLKLEEEKANVEKEIVDLKKPEESASDNLNAEDIAQEATEDIVNESLTAIHKNILEKIDDALYRINDATYGRCLLCGKEVSEADLEKEPWAEHCEICGKNTV
jgi:DnaK suppressor protein